MIWVYAARKLWFLEINQYHKSTLKLMDAKKIWLLKIHLIDLNAF
jgi:hypothetical protein